MGPWNFCNQAIGSLAGQNRGGGAGKAAPAASGDGGRRRRGDRGGRLEDVESYLGEGFGAN